MTFLKDQSGAVTIDWLLLTTVILGLLVAAAVFLPWDSIKPTEDINTGLSVGAVE